MRCRDAERLVDHYADGLLPAAAAAGLERHAAGCLACRRRIEEARQVSRLLAAEATAARPSRGFADRVMDRVWRETLWAPAASEAARRSAAVTVARGYRRLGISVMLGAALLVAGIALPRTLGLGAAGGGPALVQRVLEGADRAVHGALNAAGGSAATIVEGRSR
jgi:anti-sigma factor RsiW